MSCDKPLVSIIIPVYNCDCYLAEAVESVLTQTYRPIEIIVVDDGSNDRSADVARSFEDPEVRYFYQPNSGLSAARNRGIRLARGSFFAFLDSDDTWLSEKLSLQMAALECDPELDMIFGQVSQFYSPELDEHVRAETELDERILPGYSAGTMLIRRESFNRVGPFAARWQVGQFIDWYIKATEKGLKSVMVPKVLMRRRIHTGNMGIRKRGSQNDYVHILKHALDRRREKGL